MTGADLLGTGAMLGASRNRDREQVIVTRPRRFPRPRAASRDGAGALNAGLLAGACVLLAALAVTMGIVSWHAQYAYVFAVKHQHTASALEALGLDAGAVIFAVLGIALARLGRRAVIERTLVCLCAAGSCAMNLAGADLGSPRSVAAFAMPPLLFAAGSDRLVAVIRRAALGPAEDGDVQRSARRPGGLAVLYLLRLAAAPPSTMAGARRALLNATPLPALTAPDQPEAVTSGTNAGPAGPAAANSSDCEPGECRCPGQRTGAPPVSGTPGGRWEPRQRRGGTKTARFLNLVTQQYGPLADLDLAKVSRIAADLAPQVDLHAGSARSALRAAVLVVRELDGAADGPAPLAAGQAPVSDGSSAPPSAVPPDEAADAQDQPGARSAGRAGEAGQ
jgi:hypothetical protein